MAENAGKVGELYVELTADNKPLISALNEAKVQMANVQTQIQQQQAATIDRMDKIGSGLTVGLTMPIVAAGVAATKYASDMQETIGKVDITFGENAEKIKEWASTSIEQMGLAQQSALDAAALYGDMGTGMGIATDANYEMATSLVQLSADLASFKNISQERAQVALQGVYTGETEALKSLGVVMTQANLQQYAATQGITKNVQAMSQREQVMLRYKYVLSVTKNAQGDFARTGGNAANQSRMLTEQIKEAATQMGNHLLPAATSLIKGANTLIKGFNGLTSSQRKFVVGVAGVAAAAGPVIKIGAKAIKGFNTLKKAAEAMQISKIAKEVTNFGESSTAASKGLDLITAGMKNSEGVFYTTQEILQHNTLEFEKLGISGDQASKVLAATATTGATAGAGLSATGTAAAAATPAVKGFGLTLNSVLGIAGLVVTGVTLLVSVFQNMGSESESASKEVLKSSEEMAAAADEFVESAKDNALEYKESAEEIETNAKRAHEMTDRYFDLAKQTDKTGSKQKEMREIVQSLTSKYSGLSEFVDESNGLFSKNEDVIRACIDAQTDYQKAILLGERRIEVIEEETIAEAKLNIAKESREKTEKDLEAAQKKVQRLEQEQAQSNSRVQKEIGHLNKERVRSAAEINDELKKERANMHDLEAEHEADIATVEKLEGSYKDLKDEKAGLAEIEAEANEKAMASMVARMNSSTEMTDAEIENMQALIDKDVEMSEADRERFEAIKLARAAELVTQEDYVKAIEDGQVAITRAKAEELETLRKSGVELTESQQAMLDKYKEIQQELVDAATNSTDEIILKEQQSFKDRKKIQKKNLETTQKFQKNYDTLMGLLPESAKKHLQNMTINDARMLDDMVKLWNNGGEKQVREYFDSLEAGFAVGNIEVEDAAKEGAKNAESAGSKALTGTVGERMAVLTMNKLNENGGKITSAAETQIKQAFNAIDSAISVLKFANEGAKISKEVASGIRSSQNAVLAAARGVAIQVKDIFSFDVSVSKTGYGARIKGYDVGGYFTNPQLIQIAEKRPEFVGAAEDLETFIDRAVNNSIVKVDPRMLYDVSPRNIPDTVKSGGDTTVNMHVTVQGKMTDGEINRVINKLDRELGRRLN